GWCSSDVTTCRSRRCWARPGRSRRWWGWARRSRAKVSPRELAGRARLRDQWRAASPAAVQGEPGAGGGRGGARQPGPAGRRDRALLRRDVAARAALATAVAAGGAGPALAAVRGV